MEFIIIGIAVVFNIIVLRFKIAHERYADAFLDAAILVTLTVVFGGTYGGMVVSTVASALISIYLYMFPPRISFPKAKS